MWHISSRKNRAIDEYRTKLLAETKIIVDEFGSDILSTPAMQSEKRYMQHGSISVFEHSLGVARLSVFLAEWFSITVDTRSLVRGALLHDYFLYDWHVRGCTGRRLHGFSHARLALCNASRDFQLGNIERDIIAKHMFPLNTTLPAYRETVVVCIADKICATYETLHFYKEQFTARQSRIGRIIYSA